IFIISIITGILGILFSTFEKDLKKILAYSSIENIGIIGIGISLFLIGKYFGNILISTLAISGTFIHIFNHSIFKPLLFYGTGNIYAKTHTKNIEELGGLIKLMPKTSYMMILGSAAITGLPLLSGFFGELLLYLSSVLGIKENSVAISFLSFVSIFSLSLIGSFALISFTKFSGITLLGLQRKPSEHEIKEDMKFSLSSMYILTTLMLLSGFFIPFVYRLFYKLINFYLKSSIDFSFTNEILFKVFVVYIIFIGIFVILFLIRELLLKNKKIYIEKVWDCGYQNGNIKMQYTASSYVQTLKNLFSILLIEKSHKDEIKDYFPGEKILKEERRDIFEKFLFSPSLNFLKNFFDMVSGIQKGSTQKYLLMGFLFIIISFLILLKV
ncbi:MAG: proton-conducting transporter membrane subunit, partial [candidate division WOR-3 bacterium]